MKKSIALNIFIKAVLPSLLCIFFLYIMVEGNKEVEKRNDDGVEIYNFNPREISNVEGVGVGEFDVSLTTMTDSVFLLCSNEDKKCYQMLVDLHSLGKDNIEYLNVLELVDSEKEQLNSYGLFKNKDLYPSLVIIKNGKIDVYEDFLTKDELNKIL
jgi:hypothetical protein